MDLRNAFASCVSNTGTDFYLTGGGLAVPFKVILTVVKTWYIESGAKMSLHDCSDTVEKLCKTCGFKEMCSVILQTPHFSQQKLDGSAWCWSKASTRCPGFQKLPFSVRLIRTGGSPKRTRFHRWHTLKSLTLRTRAKNHVTVFISGEQHSSGRTI